MARTRAILPTEHTLLQGVAIARWAAWTWLAMTTFIQRRELDHRFAATAFVALALAFTIACTVLLREAPLTLLQPATVLFELALAASLLVGDGWVFRAGHSFGKGQNLAGNWPLIAALSASTALGPWVGGGLAALVGAARYGGGLVNGVRSWPGDRVVSVLTTMIFYGVAGVMWGLVTRRLREVESEVAMRRARDEVARTLHDGVLQTLALVERRTRASDPELAAVARASDRELRAWLFHGEGDESRDVDLETLLRRAADRVATMHDVPVTVSVVDDGDRPLTARSGNWIGSNRDHPADAVLHALVGAATEALTNAAKHAEAHRVVVFGEVDDNGDVFVSVRDDGVGYDPTVPTGRQGVTNSIVARMADVGGRAEIVSAPNKGTEVRLWSR